MLASYTSWQLLKYEVTEDAGYYVIKALIEMDCRTPLRVLKEYPNFNGA